MLQIQRMAPILVFAAAMAIAGEAAGEARWYRCTAWGGSHTGHYDFLIDPQACTVFWKQIGRHLEPTSCAPPAIVAQKPFAPADGYLLRFNLATGTFSDHVPGWADRGSCQESNGE